MSGDGQCPPRLGALDDALKFRATRHDHRVLKVIEVCGKLRPLLFRDQAGWDSRRVNHHVARARHVDDEIEDLGAPKPAD